MTYYPSYPVDFVEIPLPVSVRMGITESHDQVNSAVAERDWNGNIVLLMSPYARKETIRLSASGKAILAEPAFDNVTIGQTLTLLSGKRRTSMLAAGATSVTLPYLVVPGSTPSAVLVSGGPPIPVTVTTSGSVSVVTIAAAQSGQVAVYYRPQISTKVLRWTSAAQLNDGLQTWTAELAEQ